MTASAAVDAVTCDGTPTIGSWATDQRATDQRATDQRARFETDAIPYMQQMFPAAYRLTSDRCDAEDLVQETFARAYVKFHQFVPGTNLRAWLYCIMFRTFYSTCRKRSRKPAEVLAADLSQEAGGQAQDSQAGLVPRPGPPRPRRSTAWATHPSCAPLPTCHRNSRPCSTWRTSTACSKATLPTSWVHRSEP